MNTSIIRRQKRKAHIRKSVSGTADVPRLSVHRSNNHMYAQLIDDVAHKTLLSANDSKVKAGKPAEKAKAVGTQLAEAAVKAKITKVVFDRSGFKFHGRIKALAEGAREGGLQF